jgi:hypothetical protein
MFSAMNISSLYTTRKKSAHVKTLKRQKKNQDRCHGDNRTCHHQFDILHMLP